MNPDPLHLVQRGTLAQHRWRRPPKHLQVQLWSKPFAVEHQEVLSEACCCSRGVGGFLCGTCRGCCCQLHTGRQIIRACAMAHTHTQKGGWGGGTGQYARLCDGRVGRRAIGSPLLQSSAGMNSHASKPFCSRRSMWTASTTPGRGNVCVPLSPSATASGAIMDLQLELT